MITKETATVYRAAGRRWFTFRAACYAAARAKINTRCDCDPGWIEHGESYPGVACDYHENQERYARLVKKLAAYYRKSIKP